MIVKPSGLLDDIQKLYTTKLTRGHTTGWATVDEHFTVKAGEFTVITGMPSHGKSEWLDALCINLSMNHNYRVAVFSPENYPLQTHLSKLIEKITQKPFYGKDRMTEEDLSEAVEFCDKHFAFIKPDETAFTPAHIIDICATWINSSISSIAPPPLAMIIDPWNEMDHYRPSGLTETEYISRVLTEIRRFAREFQIHVFLVAHPMKMQKLPNGTYPVPRPYDISGSAHWYNKADNCIAVWRDTNASPEMTEVHIQKVRFKRTGKPGMVELKYNQISTCYEEPGGYHLQGKTYMRSV